MKKTYDVASLHQAIQDFNNWNGAADLYFRSDERNFDVEVYHNDVGASQTTFNENCVVVYSKRERDGKLQIGDRRTEYIEKFIAMLDDGWKPHQIEYQLAAPGIF